MVKLDVTCMRHMSKNDYRVLTAVEMGMKNHDVVPTELITSIAKLRTGGVHRIITTLHAFKLIAHDRSTYDGYRLTFTGYDVLALHVLVSRGHIAAVGNKVGCGKESDIYIAQTSEGDQLILKMHRLGRTSFRAVKQKRDYLRGRSSANWLYLSRLSALKEYAFMKALHAHGFPTPLPVDQNRHVVLMGVAKGNPMYQLRAGALADPETVYRQCMELIVRLARHGLIHCDFNEFNLLLHREEGRDDHVTLIDFPQMVSMRHQNAEEMFDRDVGCIVKFFAMKMKWDPPPELIPSYGDVVGDALGRLDDSVRASGFSEEEDKELLRSHTGDASDSDDSSGSDGDAEDDGSNDDDDADDVDEINDKVAQHRCSDTRDGSASDGALSGSDDAEDVDGDDAQQGGTSGGGGKGKGAPSLQQRALEHARRQHGGGGTGSAKRGSRNVQKQRFRGKVLRKGQDF
ncbi:RIO1 family-domain-containing protein [Tribonema minus]|uniref:Serine/threonine-protein kinase RIO2 n=1 Tax=Tribonema minus TaxID=303371 RepID=A0A835YMD3_9STRA|nr:RIO1 family-domain-containing protein [Tribonema minus]